MSHKTIYDHAFVKVVENRLMEEGLISKIRTASIDSLIPDAWRNARKRLFEHKKANKGQTFYKVTNSGGRNNNGDTYRHDLLTEFYCDEMNKLTIAAGLRCQ